MFSLKKCAYIYLYKLLFYILFLVFFVQYNLQQLHFCNVFPYIEFLRHKFLYIWSMAPNFAKRSSFVSCSNTESCNLSKVFLLLPYCWRWDRRIPILNENLTFIEIELTCIRYDVIYEAFNTRIPWNCKSSLTEEYFWWCILQFHPTECRQLFFVHQCTLHWQFDLHKHDFGKFFCHQGRVNAFQDPTYLCLES